MLLPRSSVSLIKQNGTAVSGGLIAQQIDGEAKAVENRRAIVRVRWIVGPDALQLTPLRRGDEHPGLRSAMACAAVSVRGVNRWTSSGSLSNATTAIL